MLHINNAGNSVNLIKLQMHDPAGIDLKSCNTVAAIPQHHHMIDPPVVIHKVITGDPGQLCIVVFGMGQHQLAIF